MNAIFLTLIVILLLTLIIAVPIYYHTQNNMTEIKFDNIFIVTLDRHTERYRYVASQLKNLGYNNYEKWSATDGFQTTSEELEKDGLTKEFSKEQGKAGCASSHIRLWKHIAENKLGWCLILEDDAHFHPDFNKLYKAYSNEIKKLPLIIFLGYCGINDSKFNKPIIDIPVMCTHAYMISHKGAQYMLDNLLPIKEPIDIEILKYFKFRSGSYIFNGNAVINGIRPHDYKDINEHKCEFSGIVYQNQKDMGRTIVESEIVYPY